MPELPEVETICQELRTHLLNKTILKAALLSTHKLRAEIPKSIETFISNTQIKEIKRRGKYIQAFLSNSQILIFHLGMSGKILIKEKNYLPVKHDHLAIYLNNLTIIYNDPRRFGLIDLIHTNLLENYIHFSKLGIEPLSNEFTLNALIKLLKNKKSNIKSFLMNSENIVGIGNIYASEVLFKCRISPLRITNNIDMDEVSLLHQNIISTLRESIKFGGSTLKDYAKVNGESGYFQNSFKVYARDGKKCYDCNSIIEKIIQNGRSSFFCKNCQK